MIKATDAKANVINYEVSVFNEIKAKVNELANVMSKTIEFHSKNGYSRADFRPYEKSRFTNVKALETAQELFHKIFEEAGYTVLENNYGKNSLIVEW